MSDHNLPTYYQAVQSLVGVENVKGGLTNGPINQITLLNDVDPPTEEAIQAKLTELQADYDAKQYQRERQLEYPNLRDCIHALLDGGDTLTELQTKRSEIKQKYPKPT